jgi:hypothetical protein
LAGRERAFLILVKEAKPMKTYNTTAAAMTRAAQIAVRELKQKLRDDVPAIGNSNQ